MRCRCVGSAPSEGGGPFLHTSDFCWSQWRGQWGTRSFFPPLSDPSWRPRLWDPRAPAGEGRLRPEATKAAATQQLVPPHCCAFLQHLQRGPTLRSINLQVSCFVSVLLSILPGCPDFLTKPGSRGWGCPLSLALKSCLLGELWTAQLQVLQGKEMSQC